MRKLRTLGDTGICLYKPNTSSGKYACFDCRVCFHKWAFWQSDLEKNAPKCLNCRKQMLYAGTAFRAPPRRDVKEWAKLEILIRGGYRFHYYGGCGPIKHLTSADAMKKISRKKRKAVDYLHDKDRIGLHAFVERRPGAGKRVLAKHWRGGDNYLAP